MSEDLASQEKLSPNPGEDGRVVDTAVGILVGWRRCSTHAAFDELIAASERHRIPMFALASALVTVASRGANPQAAGTAARLAAEREWGKNHWL
ncbi:MAG TPA: ANTAR domain-containing protein [Mycobacterium sp.]|nr:ANTAR domain-containing protein [Mycobacterium sp.]